MSEQLELSAWRFLAAHRVGGLCVTHVSFIDGDNGPTMNTPSVDGFYESAFAPTFGEAAIELALALGMLCELERKSPEHATPSLGTPSAAAESSSSAPTASRRSGAKSPNSRRTRSLETGSTTGATSAVAPTGESRNGVAAREYLESLRREALRSADEWARAGYADEADIRLTVAK